MAYTSSKEVVIKTQKQLARDTWRRGGKLVYSFPRNPVIIGGLVAAAWLHIMMIFILIAVLTGV